MMAPWLALTSFAAYDIPALDEEGEGVARKRTPRRALIPVKITFAGGNAFERKRSKSTLNVFINNYLPS
jgi:hypothetical protein